MIGRIWHGWTTEENAGIYENLLKTEIFQEITSKKIRGFRGIKLFRRSLENEVEFVTLMEFDSLDDVIEFAGKDYERAYVPAKAREVLARFDQRSQHYEINTGGH